MAIILVIIMQSIQRPEEMGFMRPEEVANVLVTAFNRRERRSRIRSNKIFVPSKPFFEKLLKNWVNFELTDYEEDNRTLSYSHTVASFTNFNELSDEWWRLFLTNPLDKSSLYRSDQSGFTVPFLLQRHWDKTTILKAYMIGLTPFKTPDVRRIVVRERAPILIPVYIMSAALEEQLWDPNSEAIGVDESNRSKALTEIIVDDLCGLYEMSATLDNVPITGCTCTKKCSNGGAEYT